MHQSNDLATTTKIMHIQPFFDNATATVTYVVSDPSSNQCAIIDPVLDFDLHAGTLSTLSADEIIDYVNKMDLKVEWILETHIHADHLTAASYLKEKLGGQIGIGERIKDVLSHWVPVFNTHSDTPLDGSQFDVLFIDGMKFKIGNLNVKVIHTPGHTPDSVSYLINDALFVGDTLFMPYIGTGRTDFPGGDAETLFHSIQKIFTLPETTRIFTCHDYPPSGAAPLWESTVDEQRQANIMINEGVTKDEFIEARNKRDHNKTVPKLLLPAIQVNMRAGKLGSCESNNIQYLKIPIKTT